MRDIKRIPRLIGKIGKLWLKSPDVRFLQFIMSLDYAIQKITGIGDLFYLEDDELEKILDQLLEE